MKNYYYLLIILFISCNSGNEKKEQSVKEVAIFEAFSISKANSKVEKTATKKVIIKRNDDNELEELIVYTNGAIKSFTDDNGIIINEGGVYVIITETDVNVLNTTSKKEDDYLCKIIKHYVGLNSLLKGKVSSIYIAASCEATGTDIEGIEKAKTFKFNKILEPNIKQLIVETDNDVFIYKLNLENEPVIFEDIEPIYRLSETSWFNDSPIEKVFLDDAKSFIESSEVEFTDHSHSINDTSLEWESNNKKQLFSLNKIMLIEKIIDEI